MSDAHTIEMITDRGLFAGKVNQYSMEAPIVLPTGHHTIMAVALVDSDGRVLHAMAGIFVNGERSRGMHIGKKTKVYADANSLLESLRVSEGYETLRAERLRRKGADDD